MWITRRRCAVLARPANEPRHRAASPIDHDVTKWGHAGVADCDTVHTIMAHNCSDVLLIYSVYFTCARARRQLTADSTSCGKDHDPVFCQRRCHPLSHLCSVSPRSSSTHRFRSALIMSSFGRIASHRQQRRLTV